MTKNEIKRIGRRIYMELYDPREAISASDIFVEGFEQGHIATLRKLLLILGDDKERYEELIDKIEQKIIELAP